MWIIRTHLSTVTRRNSQDPGKIKHILDDATSTSSASHIIIVDTRDECIQHCDWTTIFHKPLLDVDFCYTYWNWPAWKKQGKYAWIPMENWRLHLAESSTKQFLVTRQLSTRCEKRLPLCTMKIVTNHFRKSSSTHGVHWHRKRIQVLSPTSKIDDSPAMVASFITFLVYLEEFTSCLTQITILTMGTTVLTKSTILYHLILWKQVNNYLSVEIGSTLLYFWLFGAIPRVLGTKLFRANYRTETASHPNRINTILEYTVPAFNYHLQEKSKCCACTCSKQGHWKHGV